MKNVFAQYSLSRVIQLFYIIVVAVLLFLMVRGLPGNPTAEELILPLWSDEGPLELSPERGKYALLYSTIENHSFQFSLPIARFATPDLAYSNGSYVSMFPPGLSMVLIPGYFFGKTFGFAQVGTYLTICIFAFLNVILIKKISEENGINSWAAIAAGLVFLFATPASAYAVSLYQHHFSTFLVLLSFFSLIKFRKSIGLLVTFFACSVAVVVDYPNLFFMFPLGAFAFLKIFHFIEERKKFHFSFYWPHIFTLLSVIPAVCFFLWFNNISYRNPLQLSGTLPSVKAIDEFGRPTSPITESADDSRSLSNPELQKKDATTFFNTRFLINGIYTHFFSEDRGVIFFSPIILLGILGIPLLYKKDEGQTSLLIAIMGVNILLYSMWGDPYGGWAFGSRYFIPTYAVLAVFLAHAIQHNRRNILFLSFFTILLFYSVGVNTIGALTSHRNPPKVEVLGLEKLTGQEEKYTYARNIDMLNANKSKSFVFQAYLKNKITAWQYAKTIIAIIFGTIFLPLIFSVTYRGRGDK